MPPTRLALAICHCWRAPMIARMAQAEALAADNVASRGQLKAADVITSVRGEVLDIAWTTSSSRPRGVGYAVIHPVDARDSAPRRQARTDHQP